MEGVKQRLPDGGSKALPCECHPFDHFCADRLDQLRAATMMDATRLHDGKRVMLKKFLSEEGPHELQISRMLSSEAVATDPRNHCVPLLDVIELSARSGFQTLMVFPLLRPFYRPRIQTFGEFASFFTQICEVRQHTPCSYIISDIHIIGCSIHAPPKRCPPVCYAPISSANQTSLFRK